MKAKEYLLQIEVLKAKIEHKRQQAKDLRKIAMRRGSFDYSRERVQSSNIGDKLANDVIRYVALEAEVSDYEYKLSVMKNNIINQIHSINNANYIKLLYKRYVECKSLGKVAREMDYSYDHIRAMHGQALQEFEEINLHTQSHIT